MTVTANTDPVDLAVGDHIVRDSPTVIGVDSEERWVRNRVSLVVPARNEARIPDHRALSEARQHHEVESNMDGNAIAEFQVQLLDFCQVSGLLDGRGSGSVHDTSQQRDGHVPVRRARIIVDVDRNVNGSCDRFEMAQDIVIPQRQITLWIDYDPGGSKILGMFTERNRLLGRNR